MHLWEKPCCFSFHIHKKNKKQAESGTKGLDFHRTSVFLQCKSLSRVSFGWLMPVRGHYLRALDAGKCLKKQRGQQWKIAKKWEQRTFPTAAPPLCFTLEYCSPTPAGGLPTDSNYTSVRFSKGYNKGMLGSGSGQALSGCHYMFLCCVSAAVHVMSNTED